MRSSRDASPVGVAHGGGLERQVFRHVDAALRERGGQLHEALRVEPEVVDQEVVGVDVGRLEPGHFRHGASELLQGHGVAAYRHRYRPPHA